MTNIPQAIVPSVSRRACIYSSSRMPKYAYLCLMILRRLHIINFKSIAAASLEFSDKVNCFVGLNGMGKTNLLDAIHYLSFTKSHLGITDTLAVKRGSDAAILDALYLPTQGDEKHILLQIRPGQKKILKRNKKEYPRLSEHIGAFPLTIISPQDYQLIQGASEERRRFVDMQLSQQDALYLNALSQYNAALEQRNSLLKGAQSSDALLDVLDQQLDRYAHYIWDKRRRFVEEFIPYFRSYYSSIAIEYDEVAIEYSSCLSEREGRLYDLLVANRGRDRLLGYTQQGIHRDDLTMTLGGELVKRVGSEGQRKTFLISLKLAQYKLLAHNSKERPLLLLDDIFDKLDAIRVARIIELVGGEDFGQIFITDTNRKHLDEIVHSWGEDYKLFLVDQGDIQTQAYEAQ